MFRLAQKLPENGDQSLRRFLGIKMGRWNAASSGSQATIELLPAHPQTALPALLDGFVGPISQLESAEQQVYVTWSQVQGFLRMAEEALRAKNAAHFVSSEIYSLQFATRSNALFCFLMPSCL